VVEEMKATAPN